MRVKIGLDKMKDETKHDRTGQDRTRTAGW